MNPSCFGAKLREVRTKHNVSGRELGKRLYTNPYYISHIENGLGSSRFPTLRTIYRICKGINATEAERMDLITAAYEDVAEDEEAARG